jgi:hypothetical protein
MKICSKCKIEKPLNDFPNDNRYKNRKKSKCKECFNIYNKEWWNSLSKDRRKNYALKIRYGITLLEYKKLLKKQKGRCAICFKKPTVTKLLQVDHNHITNKIRGLLCDYCNRNIVGTLENNTSLIKQAMIYLGLSL